MPVVARSSFRTDDPDAAHDVLNAVYASDRPITYAGDGDGFACSVDTMELGELHAGRLRHTMRTHADGGPFEDFIAATFLAGGMQWQSGGDEVRHGPGSVGRCPDTTGLVGDWSAFDFVLIRIPMTAVQQLAESHFGGAGERLQFDGLVPVSAAATAQWRSLSSYLFRALAAADDAPVAPLLYSQLIEMTAAMALTVFPNSTMSDAYVPGPGRLGPAALRRAVAFIEAHAREPITLTEIAAAAGTTGRAVQVGFQRHYGTTPTEYLRRVRLEGAHRDLQAADPSTGATVAAIAALWGFGHAARFSDFYRETFGQLPSYTLRT